MKKYKYRHPQKTYRHMKHKIAAVSLALACVSLCGCDITADPTHGMEFAAQAAASENAANGIYKIGVTYADFSNSVWAEEADAIETLGKELGHEIILTDCANDATTQVNQIENFVAMGCNAIIVGATDPGTIDSAIQSAMEAGVVVEAFGTRTEYYTATLLADNEGAGTLLAEACAEDMKARGNTAPQIAVVNYYGSDDCMTRAETFEAEIVKLLPDTEIVAEESSTTTDANMKIAENFMQACPGLDAIFCIGDSAAVGVLQAILSAGKGDQIGVYSCDGSINGLSMMAQGAPLRADCSFGSGQQLGEEQLNLVLKILNNEDFEAENLLPNTIITPENLKEMVVELGYEGSVNVSGMK